MDEPKPEDSMEPIDVEVQESHPISTNREFDGIDKMLSQSINLSSDGSVHEPTCLICASAVREEAEELWEKSCSNRDVIKLIRDKTGKKISADVALGLLHFRVMALTTEQ